MSGSVRADRVNNLTLLPGASVREEETDILTEHKTAQLSFQNEELVSAFGGAPEGVIVLRTYADLSDNLLSV